MPLGTASVKYDASKDDKENGAIDEKETDKDGLGTVVVKNTQPDAQEQLVGYCSNCNKQWLMYHVW